MWAGDSLDSQSHGMCAPSPALVNRNIQEAEQQMRRGDCRSRTEVHCNKRVWQAKATGRACSEKTRPSAVGLPHRMGCTQREHKEGTQTKECNETERGTQGPFRDQGRTEQGRCAQRGGSGAHKGREAHNERARGQSTLPLSTRNHRPRPRHPRAWPPWPS